MAQEIKSPAEKIAEHFDETPGELLKRLQQHLEFTRNLPPKLLAYVSSFSSRQTSPSNERIMTPQYNATLSQKTVKPEQVPVLLARNVLVGQCKQINEIEHLDLAGRLKTRLKS